MYIQFAFFNSVGFREKIMMEQLKKVEIRCIYVCTCAKHIYVPSDAQTFRTSTGTGSIPKPSFEGFIGAVFCFLFRHILFGIIH